MATSGMAMMAAALKREAASRFLRGSVNVPVNSVMGQPFQWRSGSLVLFWFGRLGGLCGVERQVEIGSAAAADAPFMFFGDADLAVAIEDAIGVGKGNGGWRGCSGRAGRSGCAAGLDRAGFRRRRRLHVDLLIGRGQLGNRSVDAFDDDEHLLEAVLESAGGENNFFF